MEVPSMSATSSRWFLERGFAEPPRVEVARGGERLYRVYSSRGSALGQWFSRTKYDNVSAAERALNVVTGVDPLGTEYAEVGNLCRFWASFDVKAGAVMHVGRVYHGKSDSRITELYRSISNGRSSGSPRWRGRSIGHSAKT
jgi:hypothetical protein